MNKIERLLEELCPDGVEYKEIKALCRRNKGISITAAKMKNMIVANGDIRVYAAGNNFIDTNDDFVDREKIISEPSVVVKSRGNIGFEYAKLPFTHKNELWSYSTNDDNLSLKFLSYYLDSKKYYFQALARATSVKLPQLSVADTDNFKIPVPPIEIQDEIVKILDSFTLLEAELEAELEARRKQYSYYLENLVNLSEGQCVSYENLNLGEIAKINTGSKPVEILDTREGFEYINAGRTGSGFVENWNCLGDTVTTPSRGQGGIGYVGYQVNPFWLGPLCYQIKSKNERLLNKYIYYFLLTNPSEILKSKKEGGTPSINKSDLATIIIPVPPLDEQRRIVEILDRFDALVNDLTSGLPAEIAARRQQYEYYRDRLLTFPEKKVA